MKHNILLYAAIMGAAMSGTYSFAQQPVPQVRDTKAVQTPAIQNLQKKKERLQEEIAQQDAKRNRQISGVTPETLEKINDRQDSICLALRSQLVDIDLEIKELSANIDDPQLLQQYNNVLNQLNLNPGKKDDNHKPVLLTPEQTDQIIDLIQKLPHFMD